MLELPGNVLSIILSHLGTLKDHKALASACKKLFVLTYQNSERFRARLSAELDLYLNVLEQEDETDTSFSLEEIKQLYNGLTKIPSIIDMEKITADFYTEMLTAHENSALPQFIKKYIEEMRNQYRFSQNDPTLDPDDETLLEYTRSKTQQYSLPLLTKRLEKIQLVKDSVTASTSTFWTTLKQSVFAQSLLPAPSVQQGPHL